MAKLYYGENGICRIEGENIKGVEIYYRGAITITDKTSDAFAITHQKNGILIFPIGRGSLNELFDYEGEFNIISVYVVDSYGEKVTVSVNRYMDYSELLTSNSEDMTILSEEMSAGYVVGTRPNKTSLRQHIIPNLNTSDYNGVLYLEDGMEYNGYYHIHLEGSIMTGREHTEDSQDLYIKQKESE